MGRDVAVLHPLNTVITEPSTGLRFVTVLVPSPLRYDHDVPRCRLRGGPDTFSGPAELIRAIGLSTCQRGLTGRYTRTELPRLFYPLARALNGLCRSRTCRIA